MKKQYQKGLFALSADPITLGHMHVIEQALEQCDELLVLVANNSAKVAGSSYLFSLQERLAFTERAVAQLVKQSAIASDRVTVMASEGLLIDVFLQQRCDVVVRGIRNDHDKLREDEQQALYVVTEPSLTGKFLYIESDENYSTVSSSWVKELCSLGIDVSAFVPLFVKQELEQRLLGQTIIGITGPVASGKSWVAEKLLLGLQERGIATQHIAIDELVRQLYAEQSPGARAVRAAIAEQFGDDCIDREGEHEDVNRITLQTKLFSGTNTEIQKNLAWIQQLTLPHVYRLLRTNRLSHSGILLIEWADYADIDLLPLVNNNTIIVSASESERLAFAQQRGLTLPLFQSISAQQRSSAEIEQAAHATADANDCGTVMMFSNSTDVEESDIHALVEQCVLLDPKH